MARYTSPKSSRSINAPCSTRLRGRQKGGYTKHQTGFLTGEHFPCHRQRVGHGAPKFPQWTVHTAKFHVQETDVKLGIMDNQLGIAYKIGNLPPYFGKRRCIFSLPKPQWSNRAPLQPLQAYRVPDGYINERLLSGHLAVDHFQTGKLDQSVAAFGIKAHGFGIQG